MENQCMLLTVSIYLLTYLLLDPEDGSQNATMVVVVVISSLKN